ncbi:MAG: class I SAM-dependent methyltransferase [Pseudomonadota bacterium]
MTDWTHGYVADLDYTYGYYRELTPQILYTATLAKGLEAGDAMGCQSYCELGCGQGFSLNVLAAANPQTQFYGTDFNPNQIAGALRLAKAAGTAGDNLHFFDTAFADFAAEPSLPATFDVIALHGIYSWINPENRQHIVDFVKQKLAVGGLLYISYNAFPGWAPIMPLRELMLDHAETTTGPVLPRVEAALTFINQLKETNPSYFTANPTVAPRFEKLQGMSRNYLAHEYFNRDWTPFYFSDVAGDFAEAKLGFAGSAHLIDHLDSVCLSDAQQKLLATIGDPVRREGLRDVMINQQFRKDIYIKGQVQHSTTSAEAAWMNTRFALTVARADTALKFNGPLGEVTMSAEAYNPILDNLAAGPKTLKQMVEQPEIGAMSWPSLRQAMAVLIGANYVQPCLPAKDDAKRKKRTDALNRAIAEQSKAKSELSYMASPVTGGGVQVDRMSQLFLTAERAGEKDPVAHVWSLLKSQGQRLLKDGKPLDQEADNLAELKRLYQVYQDKMRAVLKGIGIA